MNLISIFLISVLANNTGGRNNIFKLIQGIDDRGSHIEVKTEDCSVDQRKEYF